MEHPQNVDIARGLNRNKATASQLPQVCSLRICESLFLAEMSSLDGESSQRIHSWKTFSLQMH